MFKIMGKQVNYGDGLIGTDTLAVNPADDSIEASPAGVKAAVPATSNKGMTAEVTTADFDEACATAVTDTPSGDGYVEVHVNGVSIRVGDAVKTQECYFSDDGGTTAKAIAMIAAGDMLYWVGSVAGYELATTDKIDFCYNVIL